MDTICDRLLITIQTYPFLFLIPITSAMNYLSNIMFGGVQSGSIGGDSIIIRSNKTTAQFSTKIGNLERLSRAEEIRWESFFFYYYFHSLSIPLLWLTGYTDCRSASSHLRLISLLISWHVANSRNMNPANWKKKRLLERDQVFAALN